MLHDPVGTVPSHHSPANISTAGKSNSSIVLEVGTKASIDMIILHCSEGSHTSRAGDC